VEKGSFVYWAPVSVVAESDSPVNQLVYQLVYLPQDCRTQCTQAQKNMTSIGGKQDVSMLFREKEGPHRRGKDAGRKTHVKRQQVLSVHVQGRCFNVLSIHSLLITIFVGHSGIRSVMDNAGVTKWVIFCLKVC
jgi:hypothetical protein